MGREDPDNPTSRLAAELQAEVAAGPKPAPWPLGCIKPNACSRHRECVYAQSARQCPHHGKDLTADIEAALREREWNAAAFSMPPGTRFVMVDPASKILQADMREVVPLDLLRRYMQRVADHEGVTFIPHSERDTRTSGGAPTASFTAQEVEQLQALARELGRE